MEEIADLIDASRLGGLLKDYAAAFGHPVFVLDREGKVILGLPQDAKPHPALAVEPVMFRGTPICHVASLEKSASEFMARNLALMLLIGYEVQSLSAEVARNYEEFSELWRLSERLGAGLSVDRVCNVLADEVMGLCPSTNVSVMLLGEIQPSAPHPCIKHPKAAAPPVVSLLLPKVSSGAYSGRASTITLSPETGIIRDALEKKQAVTVSDVSADERFEGFPYPVRSLLVVPLTVEETVIGAVVANDKLDGTEYFTTEIKLISSIATECAVSIKKALLYDEVSNMLFGITEAFAFAIDAKHPYTYGHSKRVSELSVNIARETGLPAEELAWIRLAGLLHDIGKIGTPEVILDKNGKLDSEEFERVRQHPVVGSKMVVHIQRMREISQWICHHHEKWDGTGYPAGLKGEEIPLESRIIGTADYFDALTSDRAYRKAYRKEEALKVMGESVGSHFDPAVFECFKRAVNG